MGEAISFPIGHDHLVMWSKRGKKRRLTVLLLVFVISQSSFLESAVAQRILATEALQELNVKGRAPKTGYDRDLFGSPWSDVDRNGCDTRNDILARDLVARTFEDSRERCVIIEGVLIDPYSGERIQFQRGQVTSLAVQIDHVVSLSNAWQTGAFRWSEEKRKRFANDPLNLLAVRGSLNAQKGDGDAATWLPPRRSYWCAFVARQIAVKREYRLWVTRPEKRAIEGILERCPKQRIPSS
ncbi:MAG: HNH endonuclease family protein [Candidatus Nanopelagicaceae bacterium]